MLVFGLGRSTTRQGLSLRMPVLRVTLWTLVISVAVVSVLPSLYAVIWAFWGTETVGVLENSPSLHWFNNILDNAEWQQSIEYSIVIAAITSLIGTILLLIHFYFMRYSSPLIDRFSSAMILLVILIPAVVYALALRIIGGALLHETVLLVIGHLIVVLPLQFYVLESAQETVASDLLFAASTLGATHFKNIIFIYLPLIADSLSNAFLVGFIVSFDELVFATFVLDSPTVTVPRRLWDQIHRSMEPSPAVISSLVAAVYLFILAVRWTFVRIRSKSQLGDQ